MTTPKATRALEALLRDCRVEMLPTFTAQRLASMFNVPAATAERMLVAARLGRGV